MPRVNIRELDKTGSETRSYIENEALMPGIRIKGLDEDGSVITLDGEYTDLDKFEAKVTKIFDSVKDAPESGEEEPEWKTHLRNIKSYYFRDYGYAMAYKLLENGLPIYYKGAYDVEDPEGDEDCDLVIDTTSTEVVNLYKEFEDRGKYDIKFVTVGAYGRDERWSVYAGKLAIQCAGARGDAYACLCAPEREIQLASNGFEAVKVDGEVVVIRQLDNSADVDKWINEKFEELCATTILKKYRKGVTWDKNHPTTEVYGTYGAMFTPNTTFPKNITVGDYTFENKVWPAFFDYLLCYAKVIQTKPSWYSIAGSGRGVCPYTINPIIEYGDNDAEILQTREYNEDEDTENHIAANLIRNVRPFGNIIWGNRTMKPLTSPYDNPKLPAQLTASSFLNIRSLCCDIKKTLYRAAREFTFEPNSEVLWINFKNEIKPILEQAKADQGIRGYKLVRVSTNAKAVLAARIIITPIEAVEDFDLTVELTDTIEVNE